MPTIEYTSFGEVAIDGTTYENDVVIFPDDKIRKRKKQITKGQHGTSHKFTVEEMKEYVGKTDIERLDQVIVGTGQYGKLYLLPETKEYLHEKGVEYIEVSTPKLISKLYNTDAKGDNMMIIHVTC